MTIDAIKSLQAKMDRSWCKKTWRRCNLLQKKPLFGWRCFSLWRLWSTTKTIQFILLYQETFPKMSGYISRDRNQLVSWFRLLLLMTDFKSPLVFIEEGMKAKFTSKCYREMCFTCCQPHLEVTLSSLKMTKLTQNWGKRYFCGFFNKSMPLQ